MAQERLAIAQQPRLTGGRMVLALTGWMDGGEVSTGTVKEIIEQLGARQVAELDAEDCYIESFPGAMEVTSLFRPPVRIEDGLITDFELPQNLFHCDESRGLLFFVGKEPHFRWREFGACVLDFAASCGVQQMFFVGSFAGTVPHTREPRLFGSVSDAALKPLLQQHGMRLSNYHGPASFATYLMTQAAPRHMQMASLVAEIPGYMEGANPLSIEAVTRRLATLLGVGIDIAKMRRASDEWEGRVTAAVAERPELKKQIRKLEERYDDELIDKPVKEWAEEEADEADKDEEAEEDEEG